MNPHNPHNTAQLTALGLLHRDRSFFPTARQRQLLNELTSAPSPGLALLGYGGAMGGGKTRAIVELAIDAALAYPNNNVLVARQHYSDLSATTMREFFAACPPELIRRRQQSPTHLVELALQDWPPGQSSTVNFRHLSDWPSLGSQQYGAVLIDEAGQVDEDAALMLLTRLRDPAQAQRWFVAASNPWPGWFERWFVRRDLPEPALEQASGQVIFIPASIPDNPHLPPNYAELNHALLPNHWRDRFIEGRFDALLGRVYPDFDTQRHLWDAPLPRFTHYIGGLDFGGQTETAHHTAGIIAGLTALPEHRPAARVPLSPPARADAARVPLSPPRADAAHVPLSPPCGGRCRRQRGGLPLQPTNPHPPRRIRRPRPRRHPPPRTVAAKLSTPVRSHPLVRRPLPIRLDRPPAPTGHPRRAQQRRPRLRALRHQPRPGPPRRRSAPLLLHPLNAALPKAHPRIPLGPRRFQPRTQTPKTQRRPPRRRPLHARTHPTKTQTSKNNLPNHHPQPRPRRPLERPMTQLPLSPPCGGRCHEVKEGGRQQPSLRKQHRRSPTAPSDSVNRQIPHLFSIN